MGACKKAVEIAGQNSPTSWQWQEKKDAKSDKSRSRRESVVSAHVLLKKITCDKTTAYFARLFPTLHPSAAQCIVLSWTVFNWYLTMRFQSFHTFIDLTSSIIPSLTSSSVNSGSTWIEQGSVSASSCLSSSVPPFLATGTSVLQSQMQHKQWKQ